MIKVVSVVLAWLLLAVPVAAQEQVVGDQFILGSTGCVLRSATATPEGAVVGKVCDVFVRTDTGDIYTKTSGAGTNTGWSLSYRASGQDVPVNDGGTGVSTLATNGVLYGNGTGVVQVTAQGPANSLLTANAGAPTFSATPTVTSLTATTSLTTPSILASGDVTFDPTGNDILPVTNYDLNLGSLSKKYLTLHAAELWVETLVAQNTIATIGGRVLVGPTTPLSADLASGATSITVKHNQMVSGDRVYLEADNKVEFLAITSGAGGGAGAYTYSVTRNLDGSGANDWFAGDALFNTGQTNSGFMDLYSVRGVKSSSEVGPAIVGNVRLSSTYNDWAPRWAIGNLTGTYGYTATSCTGSVPCYGAAFGNPSAAWIKIDTTNGVRIGHNATTLTHIDGSGNATFTGTVNATAGYFGDSVNRVAVEAAGINVGSTGSVRGGQTAYNTGTGFWMGNEGGTYKFSVGTPSGFGLKFDGTNLEITKARISLIGGVDTLFDDDFTGLNVSGAGGRIFPGRVDATGGYQTTYYLASDGSGLRTNGDFRADVGLNINNKTIFTNNGIVSFNSTAAIAYTVVAFYRASALQGSIAHLAEGTTSYNTSSDRRFKTDIRPTTVGLTDLRQIAIHDFAFLADEKRTKHSGVMGDELEAVWPRAVGKHDGFYQVDYSKLVPLLIRAVQELDAEVSALKAKAK